MKKIKLLIVALIVMAHSASYAIGIDTSVEFALSQANFKVSGLDIQKSMGYGVGVSAKLDVPIISVGPELWYYRNTASLEGDKLVSNSIDLPVVVSYTILGPLSVEAGPSFSLLSSGKYKTDTQNYKLGRIRPDLGYVLGARITLLDRLMVNVRFNGCFSKESVDYNDYIYQVRYNAWSVGMGIKF
ncbi:MAG: outer membrane beta-barrel protein [Rikenellaceae bacterium]